MEMKDRIKTIRKENELSQVELALRLDVSQSVISLIESGQASVSLEFLKKFTQEFDLSSDWLIYGRNRFVKLSPTNDFIPLINIEAQAGYLSDPGNAELHEQIHYRLPGYEGGLQRIFEVDGDAMAPGIHPKDMLVCTELNKSAFFPDGEIYLLITKNSVMHRRVYRDKGNPAILILKSDNGNYSDENLPLNAVAELWAVQGKITAKFADEGIPNLERVDKLEKELDWIKTEIENIQKLQTRPTNDPAEGGGYPGFAGPVLQHLSSKFKDD